MAQRPHDVLLSAVATSAQRRRCNSSPSEPLSASYCIIEPIGCGFANSLQRYWQARQQWPDLPIMMGIGNLTELSEVDSAGVNFLLAGYCEELGIGSVLTTEVINWCRSAVARSGSAIGLAVKRSGAGPSPSRSGGVSA